VKRAPESSYAVLTGGKRWANNGRVPLEIRRLHLARLQGVDGRRWPVHGFVATHGTGAVLVDTGVGGHQCVLVRGDGEAFDLLIGDAAYTPRVYADPGPLTGDRLPPGQASDLPAWRHSLRRIRSLGPDRVHFCHHTDVIHR
jgi:hypothetical protein